MKVRALWPFLLLVPPVVIGVAMLVNARNPPFAEDPLAYLFDALTGVIITAAGLVAMARRPRLRTGPALVVAGYWWYIGSLYTFLPSDTPAAFLGFVLRGYYDVIIAFVVLAFPGDRLETRRDRLAVLALLATMLARSGWRLLSVPPGVAGIGDEALANPFRLLPVEVPTFVDVDEALSVLVSVALLLVVAAAIVRLAGSRPGARRIMVPVLAGSAAWATVAAAYGAAGFTHYRLGFDIVPWEGPGWTIQYLVRILGPLGILIGMVRLRAGSSAAVALLSTPGGPPRRSELEQALRHALDDPTLNVLYPAGGGEWLHADGSPASLPDEPTRAVTLVHADGVVRGAVVHDAALLDDPVVVPTVAAVAGLAIHNEQLQDDLRAQLQEVRESRTRIVEAADNERRRVERDLHDGAQQRLVGLAVSLRTIRTRLGDEIPPAAALELDAAANEVRLAITELRELAQGLDPAILREAGLSHAVQSLADRSPVPVEVDVQLDRRLPARVETAAYFVASEALANVAKHAQASKATVRAERLGDDLRLEVADNGVGGADAGGAGLRGLMDRIAAVNGTFTIGVPPGGGTSIQVTIPCGS